MYWRQEAHRIGAHHPPRCKQTHLRQVREPCAPWTPTVATQPPLGRGTANEGRRQRVHSEDAAFLRQSGLRE